MLYLLHNISGKHPVLEILDRPADNSADSCLIDTAHALLLLYVDTEENSPLFPLLQQIRDRMLQQLDQVSCSAEIHGLIHWLLRDLGIDHRGETLEDTAERLADLEIESVITANVDLLYLLREAVERIEELELND